MINSFCQPTNELVFAILSLRSDLQNTQQSVQDDLLPILAATKKDENKRKTRKKEEEKNNDDYLVSSGTNGSAIARTTSPLLSIALARFTAPRAVASAFNLECRRPSAIVTAPNAAGSPSSTPRPLEPLLVRVEAPPGRKRPAARPSWRSLPVCLGALAPSRTWTDSHSRLRLSPAAAPREWPLRFASEAIHFLLRGEGGEEEEEGDERHEDGRKERREEMKEGGKEGKKGRKEGKKGDGEGVRVQEAGLGGRGSSECVLRCGHLPWVSALYHVPLESSAKLMIRTTKKQQSPCLPINTPTSSKAPIALLTCRAVDEAPPPEVFPFLFLVGCSSSVSLSLLSSLSPSSTSSSSSSSEFCGATKKKKKKTKEKKAGRVVRTDRKTNARWGDGVLAMVAPGPGA